MIMPLWNVFFKYLKKEETNRRNYSSLAELQISLFQYINGFYNSLRPHSHNNGLSPNQAEALYFSFLYTFFVHFIDYSPSQMMGEEMEARSIRERLHRKQQPKTQQQKNPKHHEQER